jgi:hypothetical protein
MTGVDTPRLKVLSLGGGTQSCALALMSAAGDLPKLDHVIFADTGGERPETYEYLEYLRKPLADAGIPFHVVSAGDLFTEVMTDTPPVLPFATRNADGSLGKVGKYNCSYDYKRVPITRLVKKLVSDGKRGGWKSATVEQWIGFSLDEIGRMKPDNECRCGHTITIHTGSQCARCDSCVGFRPWRINVFPLIDLRMKRSDTIRWFTDHGHPVPRASSCWFCPHSDNDRWQNLHREHPVLFGRAVELDEYVRDGGGANRRIPMQGTQVFLHGSRVPLVSADLRNARQVIADAGQGALFDDEAGSDCATGVCFT